MKATNTMILREIFKTSYRKGVTTGSQHNSRWRCKRLVHDVACVAGAGGLKHEHLGFNVSHGAMLDTTRDDTQLTGLQSHAAVAKLNRHLTAPDQEHLILLFVMVPRKDALELHKLQFLAIHLRHDLRSP